MPPFQLSVFIPNGQYLAFPPRLVAIVLLYIVLPIKIQVVDVEAVLDVFHDFFSGVTHSVEKLCLGTLPA